MAKKLSYNARTIKEWKRWKNKKQGLRTTAHRIFLINQYVVKNQYWQRIEGVEGLFYEAILSAIKKWNPPRGAKFITLALQGTKDRMRVQNTIQTKIVSKLAQDVEFNAEIHGGFNKGDFVEWLLNRLKGIPTQELSVLRTREVFSLIAQGYTLAQVEKTLGVPRETIRAIVTRAYDEYKSYYY